MVFSVDMLWVPEDVNVDFLPSPDSLKGKVLIKVRHLESLICRLTSFLRRFRERN